jgi:hypothetical protein
MVAAGGSVMSVAQWNDGGLCSDHARKVPLCDCSFASSAARLKHIDRHDEREAVKPDVHVVIHNLVVWHPPKKTRQLHTQLPESETRTGSISDLTFDRVKWQFSLNSKAVA